MRMTIYIDSNTSQNYVLLTTKGKAVALQWGKIGRQKLNQMIKSNIINNGINQNIVPSDKM